MLQGCRKKLEPAPMRVKLATPGPVMRERDLYSESDAPAKRENENGRQDLFQAPVPGGPHPLAHAQHRRPEMVLEPGDYSKNG